MSFGTQRRHFDAEKKITDRKDFAGGVSGIHYDCDDTPCGCFCRWETVENVRSISITKNTTQEELDAWAEGAAVITGNPGESRTITLNKNISLASGQNINFGQFDYTGSGEGRPSPI